MASRMALFGSIALHRGYCRSCNETAFVLDGFLKCCGESVASTPRKYERVSQPVAHRHRRPGKAAQAAILEAQGQRCLYCELPFGYTYISRKRLRVAALEWDHKLPFAYSQNELDENFAAACSLCNSIKADYCFQTLDEARLFISQRKAKRGVELES